MDYSSKRGERGFNQAESSVRSAAKRLPQRLEVATVLQRQRATHSQVGLTREERIANMRGALRVTDSDWVKRRTVIVDDDVMTTGTTVSECARVLRKAGAERVWAATVGRTLKEAALPVSVEHSKEEGAKQPRWLFRFRGICLRQLKAPSRVTESHWLAVCTMRG